VDEHGDAKVTVLMDKTDYEVFQAYPKLLAKVDEAFERAKNLGPSSMIRASSCV
jgi:hypothetical protein